MNNKSAKDIAFERERTKLQRQKREVEEQLRDRDKTIKSLIDKISELENVIVQKDEWIERLLEYTELTKEDLKIKIEKDKASAEALKTFNSLMGLCGRFY